MKNDALVSHVKAYDLDTMAIEFFILNATPQLSLLILGGFEVSGNVPLCDD
jgi:hypothetical protein